MQFLAKFTKFRVIPIIFTGAVMGHPYCWESMPNLVPRVFPWLGGGTGKDPGIGWSRVHLTP